MCWLPLLFVTAQTYNNTAEPTIIELKQKKLSGYATLFDFPEKEVKRSWWKFAQRFGHTRDQRTHYEVVIPGNTDNHALTVAATFTDLDGKTKFSLALQAVESGNLEDKYDTQCKDLLMAFKRWHYLNTLQRQLDTLEKQMQNQEISVSAYDSVRSSILEQIKKI